MSDYDWLYGEDTLETDLLAAVDQAIAEITHAE